MTFLSSPDWCLQIKPISFLLSLFFSRLLFGTFGAFGFHPLTAARQHMQGKKEEEEEEKEEKEEKEKGSADGRSYKHPTAAAQ